MTTWCFLSPIVIEHESGFRLKLESGSWNYPAGLDPSIPEGMEIRQTALLMREGLAYACRYRKTRPSRKTAETNTN